MTAWTSTAQGVTSHAPSVDQRSVELNVVVIEDGLMNISMWKALMFCLNGQHNVIAVFLKHMLEQS